MRKLPAQDETECKVNPKCYVTKKESKLAHFGTHEGLCHLTNAELDRTTQEIQWSSCPQRHHTLTAAKVSDAIFATSRLFRTSQRRCKCIFAGAMKDASENFRLLEASCPLIWIRLPRSRRPKSGAFDRRTRSRHWNRISVVIHCRDCCGTLAKRFVGRRWEKVL